MYVVEPFTITVELFTPLAKPPDEVHVYVLPAGVAVPERVTKLLVPHPEFAV